MPLAVKSRESHSTYLKTRTRTHKKKGCSAAMRVLTSRRRRQDTSQTLVPSHKSLVRYSLVINASVYHTLRWKTRPEEDEVRDRERERRERESERETSNKRHRECHDLDSANRISAGIRRFHSQEEGKLATLSGDFGTISLTVCCTQLSRVRSARPIIRCSIERYF